MDLRHATSDSRDAASGIRRSTGLGASAEWVDQSQIHRIIASSP
jgi:hypothetical protein